MSIGIGIVICASANPDREVGLNSKRAITVEILPREEIAIPASGYFDIRDYKYYLVSSGSQRFTALEYDRWTPQFFSSNNPTFYLIEESGTEAVGFKSAYLLNRRTTQLAVDSIIKPRAWSLMERKRVGWPSAFDTLDSSATSPKEVISARFGQDSDFIANLAVLDLTYSFLDPVMYGEIARMRNLKMLALPMWGSDLASSDFIASKSVEELVVWNTFLSDSVLRRLSEFRNLKRLVLNGCGTSEFRIGSPPRESDPLIRLSKQIEDLAILNSHPSVESLFSNLPWEKLKKGTFDFIPSTVRIDKLEQLTILVDQEYSDGFFRHLGPLSLRFGIDKSEIVIVK